MAFDTISIKAAEKGAEARTSNDGDRLAEFGYKEELNREMGQFAIFAFSFSCVSLLPNWLASFNTALLEGGAMTMFWGWIVAPPFILILGLCIAEACSAYPVNGAIYSWCYILTSKKCAPFVSWVVSYLTLIGSITAEGAIAYSLSNFILSLVQGCQGQIIDSMGVHVGIYVVICIVSSLVAFLGLKFTDRFTTFLAYLGLVGTLLFMIIPLVMCRDKLQSPEFVFTEFINQTGYDNNGLVFLLGLLQAVWSFNGFFSSTNIVEGTKNSSVTVPRGIVYCIIGLFVQGSMLILPVLFTIQDFDALTAAPFPVAEFLMQVTHGNVGVSVFLLIIAAVLQFGCMCNCTVGCAQLIWAMARDGMFPMSRWYYRLHWPQKVPVNAVLLQCIITIILILPAFGSDVYWYAFLSTTIICVTLTGCIPFVCRLIWSRHVKFDGPFNLGRFSLPLNVISIVWCVFLSVILCFPTVHPVDSASMNYTSLMIGFCVLLSIALWFTTGRHIYKGPGGNVHE
ncbi:amino acid/polyamine transporter I [Gongronella butleri]|nr:amino acid/polyamine transporter I [Gongronella butleri]